MGQPLPEQIQAARRCTLLRDKHGRLIYVGDLVSYDGFVGRVLFKYGAYRVDVSKEQKGTFLKYNSSLLFQEGVGSAKWTKL